MTTVVNANAVTKVKRKAPTNGKSSSQLAKKRKLAGGNAPKPIEFSSTLNGVLSTQRLNTSTRFTGLGNRYVNWQGFADFYEEHIASPVPPGAERRALGLVIDLLHLERQDPTYHLGYRTMPVVDSKVTNVHKSYKQWVSQCSRLCSSLMRIAPLFCYCLSDYPARFTKKSSDRRKRIAEWLRVLTDGDGDGAMRWSDMMDSFVQRMVPIELEHVTGLLPVICQIISPYYICTCKADGESSPGSYIQCRCQGRDQW